MIEDAVRRKIGELIVRAQGITGRAEHGIAVDSRHLAECVSWTIEAVNVIEFAIPLPDNAYRRLAVKAASNGGELGRVESLSRLLPALVADMDAGLIGNLGDRIRAEIFDDFLDHAESYLIRKRKNEAGVIVGVVFEDTIRRICRMKGIIDKDVSLEDLINKLSSTGVITGQQAKQAKVCSHVRTKATHAQWDEFDEEGVLAAVKLTRLLLAEHLGG